MLSPKLAFPIFNPKKHLVRHTFRSHIDQPTSKPQGAPQPLFSQPMDLVAFLASIAITLMSSPTDNNTTTNADLDQLAAAIAEHGNTVKTLKADQSAADPAAIKAAVDQLLAAKRAYAAANNGIGVDGKPYVEGGKKAQKKAATTAGPAKPVCQSWMIYM